MSADDIDAVSFRSPVTQPAKTKVEEGPLHYKMTHPRRGTAVIFNHYEFKRGLKKRDGTEKDREELISVLGHLKFDVVVHDDLKHEEVFNVIDELSKADHSDADCLLIAVLSHGDPGKIWARDHRYPPEELFESFAGDKCVSLVGKPKLFFIQACRGDLNDKGVEAVHRDVDNIGRSGSTTFIPVMADILIMYSSFDGHVSWRHPKNGSWFIQTLCAELKKHAGDKDLLTILTYVNYTVAVHYGNGNETGKQIGTVLSTLTRQLCFYQVEK